jgi:hypothetical protein
MGLRLRALGLGLGDSLSATGISFYLAAVTGWLLDLPATFQLAMMAGFTAGLLAVLPLRVRARLRRLRQSLDR